MLILTNNYLTKIPTPLPPNLCYLYASNNRLTELPATFPSTLTNLSVHNNYITHLPDLPPNITILYASYNEIKELPRQMPPNMINLIVTGNHFLIPQTREDEEGSAINVWVRKLQEAQEAAIAIRIAKEQSESKERTLARTEQIKEELQQALYHPDRIAALLQAGMLFELLSDYNRTEAAEAQAFWVK